MCLIAPLGDPRQRRRRRHLPLGLRARAACSTRSRRSCAAGSGAWTATSSSRRRASARSPPTSRSTTGSSRTASRKTTSRRTPSRSRACARAASRSIMFLGPLRPPQRPRHDAARLRAGARRARGRRPARASSATARSSPTTAASCPSASPRDVIWAGRVDWDRPRYYVSADVHCTPCNRASFGMVLLEAMSCGRPVVASRISGFQLLMEHGRQGLMVAPGRRRRPLRRRPALPARPAGRARAHGPRGPPHSRLALCLAPRRRAARGLLRGAARPQGRRARDPGGQASGPDAFRRCSPPCHRHRGAGRCRRGRALRAVAGLDWSSSAGSRLVALAAWGCFTPNSPLFGRVISGGPHRRARARADVRRRPVGGHDAAHPRHPARRRRARDVLRARQARRRAPRDRRAHARGGTRDRLARLRPRAAHVRAPRRGHAPARRDRDLDRGRARGAAPERLFRAPHGFRSPAVRARRPRAAATASWAGRRASGTRRCRAPRRSSSAACAASGPARSCCCTTPTARARAATAARPPRRCRTCSSAATRGLPPRADLGAGRAGARRGASRRCASPPPGWSSVVLGEIALRKVDTSAVRAVDIAWWWVAASLIAQLHLGGAQGRRLEVLAGRRARHRMKVRFAPASSPRS